MIPAAIAALNGAAAGGFIAHGRWGFGAAYSLFTGMWVLMAGAR